MNEEYRQMVDSLASRPDISDVDIDLLHGAIGCSTEAGELLDSVKRVLFYGEGVDRTNIKEEAGDLLFYLTLALMSIDVDIEEAFEANIRKLSKRYGEDHEFSPENAINRDTDEEREALDVS